ncbi:MAG: hypothetical protein K9N62_20230 [Verrucomicrobia bacterium]|nr:hypothetical protein [Verrucomicrobiota bacterium]
MKKLIPFSIVFVLALGSWLAAQQKQPPGVNFLKANPGASSKQPAPEPDITSTNEAQEMMRQIQRAMSTPPAAATPAAMPVPGGPTPIPTPDASATPDATPDTRPTINGRPIGSPRPQGAAPASPISGFRPAPTGPTTNRPPVSVAGAVSPTEGGEAGGVPVDVAAMAQDAIIPAGMLQVQGMPLDQFFEIYSAVSGLTVLRPYQLQGAPQGITLKAQTDWTRKEAVYAMDAVLALNNIAMIPVDDKFVKALPEAEAPSAGSAIAGRDDIQSVRDEQFITKVVELKTLKPSELAQLLASFSKIPNAVTAFDSNNTIVIREYASNVKRMMEVIDRVDIVRESDYSLEVIPIKYGKVSDLYTTMSSLISGGGGAGGVGAAAAATTQGVGIQGGGSRGGTSRMGGSSRSRGGSSRGGGFGGGAYGGGYGGFGSSFGGGYSPYQAATAAAGQSSFQQRLQQIVSKASGDEEVKVLEDARIVPDERSNTLLIFANKRDMVMITNIVSKVDVLLAQVLIEAIILEVKLGESQNVGVSMVQNPQKFGNNVTSGGINNGQSFLNGVTNLSSGLPAGFSYFGKISDDLDVAISAIAQNSSVNVMSRPRIQTSHAISGGFSVSEEVPYSSGMINNFFGGAGSNNSIVQYLQIGVDLYVTPFITPEGLVVMEIEQEFSTRGQDVVIDNNPIPVVNSRVASATLTMQDGDTIMMGGFITENKTKSKSGVPVLKDIPFLGALFRNKNTSSDRAELIVFMRATVLKDPQDAAILATREKDDLQGIRQAEREFEQSAEGRRKAFEKENAKKPKRSTFLRK